MPAKNLPGIDLFSRLLRFLALTKSPNKRNNLSMTFLNETIRDYSPLKVQRNKTGVAKPAPITLR
jgi:hypothetical protein